MYSGFRRGFLRPRGIFTDSHYAKFPPPLENAPGNGTNGTLPQARDRLQGHCSLPAGHADGLIWRVLRETVLTVHSPRPGTGYEVTAHYPQDMQLASFGECSGKRYLRYTPPGPGPATRPLLTTRRTCSWHHSESAPGNCTNGTPHRYR